MTVALPFEVLLPVEPAIICGAGDLEGGVEARGVADAESF
jgi:hypothetical protein